MSSNPVEAAVQSPSSSCPHVRVLESVDTDEVSWRFDGIVTAIDGTLVNPGENLPVMDVGQGVALINRASADGIDSVAIQRVFKYQGGSTLGHCWK